ncbi:MAG TPA: hypothetical protein VME46_22055 [Acidimicrobiales bacterium]|nr:hypothetical protein [Acidimicrobiales bacterium]
MWYSTGPASYKRAETWRRNVTTRPLLARPAGTVASGPSMSPAGRLDGINSIGSSVVGYTRRWADFSAVVPAAVARCEP